jgi:20S proteasome subunit beta 5
MNSLVSRYANSSSITQKDIEREDIGDVGDAMWGSAGGFAVGASGVPSFTIPRVPDVSSMKSIRITYLLWDLF